MNRDSFNLHKDLVLMYADPAVQQYRDDYMYDHIYSSFFKDNITSYSYNEAGITLKILKTPEQNSDSIIGALQVIFTNFVLEVINRFRKEYGDYICQDVYAPGSIHQQSLGHLAFDCCYILDMTPPNSNTFVIVLKYFL